MPADIKIANLRKDYSLQSLSEDDVDVNPITQFEKWWNEVIESKIEEPNAMTLATATKEGRPDARIVLLKGFSDKGFIFFSNYESRKARELNDNPLASLVFFWRELERQIRVEGNVKRISSEESDEYFLKRPRESRISAWSSPQSTVIQGREKLENAIKEFKLQFPGESVPRPPYWGGYIVIPEVIEFWQGRRNRLHDRIRYICHGNQWDIERLAP